jgi:hypothetical protein
VDSKLFDWNSGFTRRFPFTITFEDFTESELKRIFVDMCAKKKWPPEDDGVANLAARRVARGRGRKDFSNAGAVRNLFEKAYQRALDRGQQAGRASTYLSAVDIIGPPPIRENVPELDRAMSDLEAMTGLRSVKEKIRGLVELAAKNYEREKRGEEP